MSIEVVQSAAGWDVVDADGTVLASFATRAGMALPRGESVANWIMSRAGTDDRQGIVPKLKRPSVRDRLRRKRRRR